MLIGASASFIMDRRGVINNLISSFRPIRYVNNKPATTFIKDPNVAQE